jgi:quercetin dioxygenase-like cupin family protein
MRTVNKPVMVSLKTGASFRLVKVTDQAGIQMPLYNSTEEAVFIVLEDGALLKIDENEHLLHARDSFIIPARQNHNLSLKSEFKALDIRSLDSKVEFVN